MSEGHSGALVQCHTTYPGDIHRTVQPAIVNTQTTGSEEKLSLWPFCYVKKQWRILICKFMDYKVPTWSLLLSTGILWEGIFVVFVLLIFVPFEGHVLVQLWVVPKIGHFGMDFESHRVFVLCFDKCSPATQIDFTFFKSNTLFWKQVLCYCSSRRFLKLVRSCLYTL